MIYDEILPKQMISTDADFAADNANMTLAALDLVATESHSTSPLARFRNLLTVISQIDDIYEQSRNAAIDYLRESNADIKTLYDDSAIESNAKLIPYKEQDGIKYKLLQIANFRNLATKDQVLNTLLLSEKETRVALNRITDKIAKRVTSLRATADYKKAKPKEVDEILIVEY